jgi:cardiolipin synthase
MLQLLTGKIAEGLDVRIIGKVESKWRVKIQRRPDERLHIRAIIRDGGRAFLGSQSLRRLELEKRREIGIIIIDAGVIRKTTSIFERDWLLIGAGRKQPKKAEKKDSELVAATS